jgi:hypothetical protein
MFFSVYNASVIHNLMFNLIFFHSRRENLEQELQKQKHLHQRLFGTALAVQGA